MEYENLKDFQYIKTICTFKNSMKEFLEDKYFVILNTKDELGILISDFENEFNLVEFEYGYFEALDIYIGDEVKLLKDLKCLDYLDEFKRGDIVNIIGITNNGYVLENEQGNIIIDVNDRYFVKI